MFFWIKLDSIKQNVGCAACSDEEIYWLKTGVHLFFPNVNCFSVYLA